MIIYATVSITNKHIVIIIGVIKTSLETLDRHPPYLISLLFLEINSKCRASQESDLLAPAPMKTNPSVGCATTHLPAIEVRKFFLNGRQVSQMSINFHYFSH